MILYLIIWRRDSMSINICELTLLIFFHMLFSEFSDVLHCEDDFPFLESVNSISSRVFIKFNFVEAHSWFKLIISEKRKHSSDDWNKSIKCVFCHWQLICSVVLLMIDVSTQITFHFLIENLALFVCFRMKCDE